MANKLQGALLVSSWVSTLLLLAWMIQLQSSLHHLNNNVVSDSESAKSLKEDKPNVDKIRAKRDIGGPKGPPASSFGGAVYTRWGRMDCPADAELVYTGFIGGTHHTHTGGGSDFICISNEPEWGKGQAGNNGYSYIYGTEYTAPADQIFDHDQVQTLANHDAICAVCRSYERTSQVMIPGRMTCTGDWVKEFHGYLMSALYTAKGQNTYICMDAAPQVDNKGFKAEGGAQLWPVEATCGSMPCPKYESGRELTCVVCTK